MKLLYFTILLFPSIAFAGIEKDLLPMIAQAESGGRQRIISEDGGYGLHQITLPLLKDYNRINKTNFKLDDMLSKRLNTKVAKWYLVWLNNYLTKYGYPNDKLRIVVAYNWGIGNLRRNKFRVPDWFKHHPNKVYRYFFIEEINHHKTRHLTKI